MRDSLETWFQREILVHEAALVRFLSRKLANPADVQDLRHDIYIRILEAAEREPPANPKAFLFSVARHILIDRIRRDRIVVVLALILLSALAWSYLLWLSADIGMGGMDMSGLQDDSVWHGAYGAGAHTVAR